MRFHKRLSRLERMRPPGSPAWWLVFVDERGIVLDVSSPLSQRWIGRHYSAIPNIGELTFGINPLVVWGRHPDASTVPRAGGSFTPRSR